MRELKNTLKIKLFFVIISSSVQHCSKNIFCMFFCPSGAFFYKIVFVIQKVVREIAKVTHIYPWRKPWPSPSQSVPVYLPSQQTDTIPKDLLPAMRLERKFFWQTKCEHWLCAGTICYHSVLPEYLI